MENISLGDGLDNFPKLRFPGFDEPWQLYKAEELFNNITDKNHPDETVLMIVQGKGTLPREQAGRNIHYDDASLANYKRVEEGDYIIHLRSFEGGLEMANETGLVSPAYTILRCKKTHSRLFYEAYFHTDEFVNHVLSRYVEGIRDGKQISYDAFKCLAIPYCSFQEQEKISSFFAVLNMRIEKQRQLVEALRKYKRGLLSKIFAENTSWKQCTIAETGEVITGSTPPTNDKENYNGVRLFCAPGDLGGVKYIRDTEKHVSERALQASRKIPVNSILVTCIGSTIGKIGISKEEMMTNQQINSIVVNSDFDCEFIYYMLENNFPKYLSHVGKQAVPILSKSQFESLQLFAPTLQEQKKSALPLAMIDERIEKSIDREKKMERLKKGLQQRLFM